MKFDYFEVNWSEHVDWIIDARLKGSAKQQERSVNRPTRLEKGTFFWATISIMTVTVHTGPVVGSGFLHYFHLIYYLHLMRNGPDRVGK